MLMLSLALIANAVQPCLSNRSESRLAKVVDQQAIGLELTSVFTDTYMKADQGHEECSCQNVASSVPNSSVCSGTSQSAGCQLRPGRDISSLQIGQRAARDPGLVSQVHLSHGATPRFDTGAEVGKQFVR